MKTPPSILPSALRAFLGALSLMFALLVARPSPGALSSPLSFSQINQSGFGDHQNSYSWSMGWFKGKLYVGTNRDFPCVESATEAFYFPNIPGLYKTNPLPGVTCPANPNDLDLRAEIWCYSPDTMQWARVYKSPADLMNPKDPTKSVARDIGYRDMIIYNDSLYALGCTAREYLPGLPGPRILSTTDGVNWTPLIDDGSLDAAVPNAVSFRATEIYNGTLFISAAPNLTGDGSLLAFSQSGTTSHFEKVAASIGHVYELNVFNNYLYIGAGDQNAGYSVWKMGQNGNVSSVVTGGAGRGSTMVSVVSMHVFQNKLYIGSAGWFPDLSPSCEMIRINPDDSWQVVVGNPRVTPSGLQFPISGLPDGFGNPFNAHIWRISDHNGVLYAGTNDDSWSLQAHPALVPLYKDQFGFDLFSSADGKSWTEVTRNGFGNPNAFGCRCLVSTTVGLFIGSVDYVEGTIVFLRTGGNNPQVDSRSRSNVGSEYRVYRAEYRLDPRIVFSGEAGMIQMTVPTIEVRDPLRPRENPGGIWTRGSFNAIGTTDAPYFRDSAAKVGDRYSHQVAVIGGEGDTSRTTNIAVIPPTTPVVTFDMVEAKIRDSARGYKIRVRDPAALLKGLRLARKMAEAEDLAEAGTITRATLLQDRRSN